MTISKAVLSLDLRLICLVTGSLTRGFFNVGIDLAWFPGYDRPRNTYLCIYWAGGPIRGYSVVQGWINTFLKIRVGK